MPRLNTDQLEVRRMAVIEGARRAFGRWGYHGCTVTRLEEEIGQSRGGIFNWFPDKWHLFLAVSEQDQQRIVATLIDPALTLFDWMSALEVPYAQAYAEALGLLANDPEKKKQWESRSPGLFEPVYAATRARQSRGELRDDISATTLIYYLLVLLDGLTLRRSLGYNLTTSEAKAMQDLALDAIRPLRYHNGENG